MSDTHLIVKRFSIQQADSQNMVCIGGKYVDVEGQDVHLDAGPVTGNWWDAPLPACPDCGGDLIWYEAGYVPGTRRCMGQRIPGTEDYYLDGGCGSMFEATTEANIDPGDVHCYFGRHLGGAS